MSRAESIYPLKQQVERQLRLINEDPYNREILLRYYKVRSSQVAIATVLAEFIRLNQISRMLSKKFEQGTLQDMEDLVFRIDQRKNNDNTKNKFRKVLKAFYRWMKGYSEGEYPAEVKWIKMKKYSAYNLKKSDLLTTEEIKKLVEVASTLRDRALILVLAESGRRIGEILTLRIGDVEFDNLGARLLVDGKTGRDHVRIISSTSTLATWLDNHPLRNNPTAPLWITSSRRVFKQLSYAAAKKLLKDCVARAGLKKRIWFHLFRHTRGTQAAKLLTTPQLCAVMGWRQASRMPSVYIHLAGEDIDEAQAIMNGVDVIKGTESQLHPLICPRCNYANSATAKFCNKCGLVLDTKTLVELDKARDKIDTMIEKLVKDPEKLGKVLALVNGK